MGLPSFPTGLAVSVLLCSLGHAACAWSRRLAPVPRQPAAHQSPRACYGFGISSTVPGRAVALRRPAVGIRDNMFVLTLLACCSSTYNGEQEEESFGWVAIGIQERAKAKENESNASTRRSS
ncbi:hypothetical protein U9M48_034120 [Paspalum notatum var. saurae]|uniref:Secreted protein n=1 Tax=Paspalum notatum var. saurae TaxID=547442 RepID=A0AAQ3UBJ7_PASNO